MSRTDPYTNVPIMRLQPSGRGTVIVYKSWANLADKLKTLDDLVLGRPLAEEAGRVVFSDPAYFDRLVRSLPELTSTFSTRRKRLERVHELMLGHVAYCYENEEIFEAPSHVWERMCGDCEDHGVTQASIVEALSRIEVMRGENPLGWH